jgi:hypothetical protein
VDAGPGLPDPWRGDTIERRRRSRAAGFQEGPVAMKKPKSIPLRRGEPFGNADRAARPRLHAHADPLVD